MDTAIILNTWWLKVLGEIEAKKTENSMTTMKNKPKYSPEVQAARNALRIKGWNQGQAAELLSVSYVHLNYVVNGRRVSALLLERIHDLPENPYPN